MLNRPTSPWPVNSSQPVWDTDRSPQIRFALLWAGVALPLLVVAGRVAHLQLSLPDDFAAVFSMTTETVEDISARDGRIASADGRIFADDVQTFDVAIHYPAIQDPPDDDWIQAKAKSRLNKKERRDREKLAEEKLRVVSENEKHWEKLALLTGRSTTELMESRWQVQIRIQQMKESVRRRYRERHAVEDANAATEKLATGWSWQTVWQRIREQIEESPDRSRGPRLIKEELDYHTVVTNVTAEIKAEIEAHPRRYPFARIVIQHRRTYPQAEMASHLIGSRKPMTEEEFKERQSKFTEGDPMDYRVGDPYGASGLERQYDSYIKGVRGRRILTKNRRGEIIEARIDREPRPGRDLTLTLDSEAQRLAEQSLDRANRCVTDPGSVDPEASPGKRHEPSCPSGGAIVALDVNTGAILVAAAAPRFDLNLLVSPDKERWDDLMADPRRPLFSRATKMKLPPGSVFKVITAVASIESGAMPPGVSFHCQGYLDNPKENRCLTYRHYGVGHGDVKLTDALCRSCNVYFYTAARRMGPQTLVDWSRRFGIGECTGIDLPSEEAGRLPSPDSQTSRWKPRDTLDLAIGQSRLEVTPLQMARVMAAIANGGYLVTPHFAAMSEPESADTRDSSLPTIERIESNPIPGLHHATLEAVREGLMMVVHDKRGTAYKTVRMSEITIAGKTGTAETQNGVDHAWFAGYTPVERPQIAFVVVIEHGGGGGKAAGPVAHEFVKSLLELKHLTKTTAVASDQSRRLR